MGEYVKMEMLSEKYGWTPQEIRDQLATDIDAYLTIHAERQGIEKRKQLKQR